MERELSVSTEDGLPEAQVLFLIPMAAYNLSSADLEDPKSSSGVCGHTKMVHTHMWAKHIKYYFK